MRQRRTESMRERERGEEEKRRTGGGGREKGGKRYRKSDSRKTQRKLKGKGRSRRGRVAVT